MVKGVQLAGAGHTAGHRGREGIGEGADCLDYSDKSQLPQGDSGEPEDYQARARNHGEKIKERDTKRINLC